VTTALVLSGKVVTFYEDVGVLDDASIYIPDTATGRNATVEAIVRAGDPEPAGYVDARRIRTGDGTATLPVKDLFLQIIDEVQPAVVLTVGTAGSVHEDVGLGDVVVTRAAKFRLGDEFRNEAFNGRVFTSDWTIPERFLEDAEGFMGRFAAELEEPPFGPPTTKYDFTGELITTPPASPGIKLDGRDMAAFHPILTTDFFEFGTSTNHLEEQGCGVEMGDAALGLACEELDAPPRWAVIRNMSDPQINGELPTAGFRLNQQTQWAVAYYEAYGYYTSVAGALATWAVIAGLEET
jgi:nucleoside phosphorylase